MITNDDEWDAALLAAAKLIEEGHFSDLRGVMARKKRDREDAQLRLKTMKEVREGLSTSVLSLMRDKQTTPKQMLTELVKFSKIMTANCVRKAMYLADAGYLTLYVKIQVAGDWSNVVGGTQVYTFDLSEKGKALLEDSEE